MYIFRHSINYIIKITESQGKNICVRVLYNLEATLKRIFNHKDGKEGLKVIIIIYDVVKKLACT